MRSELAKLAASFAVREASEIVRRVRTTALYNLLAVLAMVCGSVFLIGAGFAVAAQRWGIAPAALGFGLGFLVLAIAVFGFGRQLQRRRARELERRRQSDARLLTEKAALTMLDSILPKGGGAGSLLTPLIILAGYAIYREHSRARDRDTGKNREKSHDRDATRNEHTPPE